MADNTVPARPTAEQYKPIDKVETIEDALKNKGMVARFQQAVPRHLSSERMLRVCAMAVYKTPALKNCEVMSLLGAMLSLASLGLEPNTPLGHAYLIPFKGRRKFGPGRNDWEDYYQVQVVIGYRGYIELARRSGMLTAIHADVVYEGDEFTFEYGSNMHLRHVPRGNRDKPLWAYAHASLSDGQAFEVLPYDLVLKIRDASQGYTSALNMKKDSGDRPCKAYDSNPWVAFEHEMASKTMVRRLSKMLPMSIEFARAVELDGMAEANDIQYSTIINQPDAVEDFSSARTPAETEETASPAEPSQAKQERTQTEERKPLGDIIDGGAPEKVQSKPVEAKPTRARTKAEDAPVAPVAQQEAQSGTESGLTETLGEPAIGDTQAAAEAQHSEERAPWELVTCDGEALPYDDPDDFYKAYLEEIARAYKEQGIDGLNGFIESNEDMVKEFGRTVNAKQSSDMKLAGAKLLAPPGNVAQSASGTLDLDAPIRK